MEFKEEFSNKKLARLFSLIAAVYVLNGENRFKVIAYQKAAETAEQLPRELFSLWQEGKLRDLPGYKASIGESVEELFKTGRSPHFENILKGVPETLPLLMDVPGIGPKKAIKLIHEFKLYDAGTVYQDILKLADEGKIATVPSFGEKSQEDIKKAISIHLNANTERTRMPLPIAAAIAEQVIEHLKVIRSIKRIDTMGSLRRQLPTIGDVDLTVVAPDSDAQAIVDRFLVTPGVLSVDNAGEKKASIILPPNVRVDLRVTDGDQYGAMLQYFTGSKQHNINLREFALKQGYSLNEYGIKEVATGKLHTFTTEESFYEFLGLDWIPPEIREGTQEIELARTHNLPHLVTVEDIQGDFHIHSSYDIKTSHDVGTHTYAEIVDMAVSLGYNYVGFADHNPRQSGVDDKEALDVLRRRKTDIDSQLKGAKIPYYIGLEVDILPSGDLAFPKDALEFVDFLIVSIHSSFNQSREEQTKRILKALSHPKVRLYGHPTGRLINKREGVQLDWRRIFTYCAERTIALEINSSPQRLDLPDQLVREGLEYGVSYMINTDSHSIEHMPFMKYGVSVARRGWLTPDKVVNCWDVARFDRWLKGE